MRKVRLLAVAVFFFILLLGCAKKSTPQVLAERVVNAAGCVGHLDPERNVDDYDAALHRLYADNSPDADKALVMVIPYYMGESNGEELVSEIVKRGKRMSPLLVEERKHAPRLWTCTSKVERKTSEFLIDEMLKAIEKGERWDR